MAAHHIVRSFDDELKYLEKGIIDMGVHARSMVERAILAIIQNDQNLAVETITQDNVLDKAERNISEKAIMIIARRQPMAVDLREVIGTIRIASDIERIGDMAKNIAKRSMKINQTHNLPNFYRSLESFSALALDQQEAIIEAYVTRSLDQIEKIRQQDDKIDSMYTSIFRELLTYMMEDSGNITACTNLLFCAKNIERMGDHVTNIAETLYYMVTGDYFFGRRDKKMSQNNFSNEINLAKEDNDFPLKDRELYEKMSKVQDKHKILD